MPRRMRTLTLEVSTGISSFNQITADQDLDFTVCNGPLSAALPNLSHVSVSTIGYKAW